VSVSPPERPIRAATTWASTTVVFRLDDLEGDVEYWLSPTVNVDGRRGDHASIRSRHVLVVFDATPLP
jgi:hypothetical protein